MLLIEAVLGNIHKTGVFYKYIQKNSLKIEDYILKRKETIQPFAVTIRRFFKIGITLSTLDTYKGGQVNIVVGEYQKNVTVFIKIK